MKTAFAAIIAAVLLPAAAAHADSADDQYIALLSAHGIQGPPDQLIADGHQTCDVYSQRRSGIFVSPYQIAMIKLSNDLKAQGYSPHAMSELMLDAARAYCPEYSPPQ